MGEAIRRLDLGGDDWQMGAVPLAPAGAAADDRSAVEEWLPARVPGDVRADLQAAGRIPDPYWGDNLEASGWTDERDWWYVRRFACPLEGDQRAFVVFSGIDYQSAVWAGRRLLGRHVGMFSPQRHEITADLRAGAELDLAVRIHGSASLPRWEHTPAQRLARAAARLAGLGELPFADRLATLKTQMSFGWDFAPRLLSMGIWDDVTLHVCRRAAIVDLWPQAEWPAGDFRVRDRLPLRLTLEIDSEREEPASLLVELWDEAGGPRQTWRFPLALAPGGRRYSVRGEIEAPALWQPWDRGRPALHTLRATLLDAGDAPLDVAETMVGLRQVRLVPQRPARRGDAPWTWVVNGQREFIRGLNWVPADALPGRLRAGDYEALVSAARDAGANLLRVWGGGLREKWAFYQTCDRLGMLVWQEFPIASVFLGRLPRDPAYLQLLRQESESIVRTLRAHPCVALWCGGNEFSPWRNAPAVSVMRQAVAEHDGSRPFVPASPYRGERHNWRVWHGGAPAADYRLDHSPFASELGLQAPPDVASLRRFLPDDELWPPAAGWRAHNAEIEKLRRYTGAGRHDLETFVAASQAAQARALQVAIEHFRRRKGACAGLAIWQWNEPWPAISWSLIDYYRRPKLAGRTLARWYDPLLVSFQYPLHEYLPGSDLAGEVWVVNDWPAAYAGCEVRLLFGARLAWRGAVDLPADSSVRVGSVQLVVEDPGVPLELELWQAGRRLAHNDYDLRYDGSRPRPPLMRTLRQRLAELLLR